MQTRDKSLSSEKSQVTRKKKRNKKKTNNANNTKSLKVDIIYFLCYNEQ